MVWKICHYSCDPSQDPKSTMKNQTKQRWDTLNIMSGNVLLTNRASWASGGGLILADTHQSLQRMAFSTMLRPVSTTDTHNTEYEQREKEHNMWGVQCERNAEYILGFTEQTVLSYSLSFPDDVHYQSMEKRPKYLFSMVIFTKRKIVPFVQACPPLHFLSSLRVLCHFITSGNITINTGSI